MKTLKVFLIALILGLFSQSCQKDINPDQIDQVTEDLSGEQLPGVGALENQKETEEEAGEVKSFNPEAELLIPGLSEDGLEGRSRYYYPLYCGTYNNGTTVGETNTVSYYPGADRIYYFDLASDQVVSISLRNMTQDLDLFLTKTRLDSYGRLRMGETIIRSMNPGREWEYVEISLPRGRYFIVVDSYTGPSSFQVRLNCGPMTYNSNCESMDQYAASYYSGVAEQSSLWKKWSSAAGDGRILWESSSRINNVVKFDQYRYGYQDVVRSLTNYHHIGGTVEIEFEMFVPYGKRADFLSEKLSRFGRYGEQGFKVQMQYGYLDFYHKGQIARALRRYPFDKWFKVKIQFRMSENKIYLWVEDTLVIFDAYGQISSPYRGIRSIWGIDFFGDSSNSFFQIDNVCVRTYNLGSTPPVIGGLEVIDMSR